MCMEDIRVGREMNTSIKQVAVPANTPVQIAGPAANRVTLNFADSTQAVVNIAPDACGDASTGFVMRSGSEMRHRFTVRDDGDVVTRPWFAFSITACVLAVQETFLNRQ